MVRLVYPAATKFKYIMQTIAKVLDQIPFIADPAEGLIVKALSADKTTMVVMKIPLGAFEEFDTGGEKKSFIVPADELNKVAKRGTRNDIVEIRLEEEQRRLVINFIDKKTGVRRTFYVPLIEGVVEELSEPQVELTVVAQMTADDFKNIVRDAKIVSDEVEFVAEQDRLIARTITPQKEYYNIMEVGRPLITYEVKTNPPVVSKYAVDLLQSSLKATQAASTATIEYGEALPMKISFDLPGGGVLVYWVSPRV